jgi:hypothetical protein
MLISDIAKTFDVLGWVSPAIIKAKIFLQKLWEEKVDWDDPVPSAINKAWSQWRAELSLLSERHIPRCYFPKDAKIVSVQTVTRIQRRFGASLCQSCLPPYD